MRRNQMREDVPFDGLRGPDEAGEFTVLEPLVPFRNVARR